MPPSIGKKKSSLGGRETITPTATNNGNTTVEITIGVPIGLLTDRKLFIHAKHWIMSWQG